MNARRKCSGSMRLAMALGTATMLAAGGAGFWLLNGDTPEEQSFAEAERRTVHRGDLQILLKRRATFEAEEAKKVRANIRGSARIVWLVDEGTTAKEGDILVELDKTDVLKEIEQLESQEEKASANLVAAEADEVITNLDCASKTLKAEMDVEMARLEIQKFKSGVQPKEERDARIKIDQTKVKLLRAGEVYKRMPKMLEQGFVTKEEVTQSKLDVDTAANELGTAELELKILGEYTHPMRLKQLEGNRKQAETELKRFEQVAKRRTVQTQATTTQRKQELKRAQEQLKDARERRDNMTMRAPGSGIVVYGSGGRRRWWQDEEIKVGGTAHRHQVLMRLPDLNTMQLVLNVHEADFGKIKIDEDHPQRATITIDSLPGKTFKGWVKRIATLAHSEWGRNNVKLFTTVVALDKQIPSMRPGMTANVEVFIKALKDVLYVPIQAVHTQRGRIFCYALDKYGKPEKHPVEIGASNDSFVEIKKGLKEGEEVLIVKPQVESEDVPQKRPTPKAPSGRRAAGRKAR